MQAASPGLSPEVRLDPAAEVAPAPSIRRNSCRRRRGVSPRKAAWRAGCSVTSRTRPSPLNESSTMKRMFVLSVLAIARDHNLRGEASGGKYPRGPLNIFVAE